MNEAIKILELELKKVNEVMGEEAIRYINKMDSDGYDSNYDLDFYFELRTRAETIEDLINTIVLTIFAD